MTELRDLRRVARLLPVFVAAIVVGTCHGSSLGTPAAELWRGTWGGTNAGVIVEETTVHVHVGCTFGDFPRPDELDAEGRFNVSGNYMLRAFPVAVGPTVPAQFAGVVEGGRLTLSVAVNDTVDNRLVALGPVVVILGQTPRLGPCPICVRPRRD